MNQPQARGRSIHGYRDLACRFHDDMRILVALSAIAALSAAQEPVIRDAATWPFAATSPWNTALGDQAVFQPIASPRFSAAKGACINAVGFSHPVFIATASDPEVKVFKKGTAAPFATIRAPADARPDPKGDGHLHLIDETHRVVVEMWQAARTPDGGFIATAVARNDLTDDGVYPAWHGVRAYGGSAIAGLIRSGELVHGVRHTLAIAVEQAALNRNGPGGKSFTWPASASDNPAGYSNAGNLMMGTLLGIPPGVDVRGSGLRGAALELAIALQDFGAYITDCTGTNLSFYAEPAAAAEAAQIERADLAKVASWLQVVANNGVQSIGGGGKRRRPAAPAFAPPGMPVHDGGLAPVITTGPAEATVQAGGELRLAVVVAGSEPLAYRWKRGGAVVGGNAPELVISPVRTADSGLYACTISNPYGHAASTPVQITVAGSDPRPAARGRPPAPVVAAWMARLQEAVRGTLGRRGVPQYRSDSFRATMSVQDLAGDGTLTVAMEGGGSMQIPWSQLRDGELAQLAVDVARGDDPSRQALAAFFLLLGGDPAAARMRLARAGAEAAAIESAFAGGE